MEEFALADDRAKVLEQLVPGTEDHYAYHCLHEQHEGRLDRAQELLDTWRQRHGETSRYHEALNRQALHRHGEDPTPALEHLRSRLGLHFSHEREIAGQKTSHPVRLDPALLSREHLRDRAYGWTRTGGFADSALEGLLDVDLDGDVRRELLGRLVRPDHPRLVDRIVEDLAHPRSGGFGSIPIHKLLLEEQLDELAKRVPAVATTAEWVHARIVRLQPGPDDDWEHDPDRREAWLERLWSFVEKLPPAFNSLKAHVLHHRLDLDRRRGFRVLDRFLAYLKLPRQTGTTEPRWLQRKEHRDCVADLSADFQAVTLLPAVGDDEALVRDYCEALLADADSSKALEPYVREDWLRVVFATTKILAGKGDAERWVSLLRSPSEFQSLKDRVDVDLAVTNRATFSADDPVTLDAFVKNVPTLVVKVFEIHALNHLLATGRDVDTSIDLDGLVATREQTFTYPEPPIRRVARTFAFPEIAKPGVYVVELIGNGKSSRALIRKGSLRFVERAGAAGHVFTVLDEKNRSLPGASLWLGGREIKPAADGTILVPYSAQPTRQTILLSHGDLAFRDTFDHKGEEYAFSAGIHVDRESLQRRRQTQVLVRPTLLLAGQPVSVSLVEQPSLTIETLDRHGTRTSKVVPAFELHGDRESTFAFQVPDDLFALEVKVSGKVKALATGQTIDVSDKRVFTLNGIDATGRTDDLHLSRTAAGFVLSFLGKTGEARPGVPIRVELTLRDYKFTVEETLQTDDRGRIELGSLPGVPHLKATTPSGVDVEWPLDRETCLWPRLLHAKQGETLSLPYVGEARTVSREAFSLLERRGDEAFVRDHLGALRLEDATLWLSGLPAGDFVLTLKEHDVPVEVRVVPEAQAVAGWVASGKRLLETSRSRPLHVPAVTAGDKELRIRVANATPRTRVHVVATRFAPAHSLWSDLGAVRAPEPRAVELARTLSHYVSGRELGDEYRYVLERKYAKKLPGTLLARPGLLLSPWAMRRTDTGSDQARRGEGYAPSPKGAGRRMSSLEAACEPEEARGGALANLDFLARSSCVVANLRPDEKGVATVARDALAGASEVRVLAVDHGQAVLRIVTLPEVRSPHEDLCLRLGLDPAKHFTEKKQVTVLRAGEALTLEDVTTSKLEVYGSLARVHGLLATLSGDATLATFSFVTRWGELSETEKRSKLSEFGCHELHFFIAKKDPAFFEKVVRPHLRNKKDKTFLDRWLVGDDLSEWLRPWAYGQLNVVERILLAQRIAAEKAATERHVGDLAGLVPQDLEGESHLFRTAIQGSALETDDALGFGAASKSARAEVLACMDSVSSGPGGGLGFGAGAMPSMAAPPSPPKCAAPAPPPAPAASRERSAKKKSRRDADEEAMDKDVACESEAADDGFGDDAKEMRRRDEVRQLYRKLDTTQELGENDYWHKAIEEQGPDLVTVNEFWRDYARHSGAGPFLSPHFARASRSFTEAMLALAVLDLPEKGETPETVYEKTRLRLRARTAAIVFHKEIKPATRSEKPVPILVSQNYFRDDDRWRQEGNERVDKYVADEFLTHVVYVTQVVLTNPTSSQQKLELLLQIPRGAIPVKNGFETRGTAISLASYATQSVEYAFYFPAPGSFPHYPVHVAKNEDLVAAAPAATCTVVDEPTKVDRTSWAHVSQNGTTEEVLGFLEANVIERLDLEKIAWRMKDRAFHEKALALLGRRHVFHGTLWSYAIHHDDAPGIREYLLHRPDFLRSCGLALESALVTIDPFRMRWYQHREYAPFVNARAHRLRGKREILNDRLREQWKQLTTILSQRPRLTDADRLTVSYYLLLQDRVDEALAFLGRVDPAKIDARLQLDYVRAYVAFLEQQPAKARAVAQARADYPVDRWRNLFRNVLAQLDEAEGKGDSAVVDDKDRDQRQGKLAATEPSFELAVEGRRLRLTYQNVAECRVNYYRMDIELLFSRQPFVQQESRQFAFVAPNRSEVVRLPALSGEHAIDLPKELHGANVIVEVVAGGVRRSQAAYAHSLAVQVVESYGQVRVAHQGTGKPLPGTYVKVFARTRSGEVRFYKDGYTDLRGRFEHASLSTDELDQVERFALLVLHEEHGAVIREAAPPVR